MSYRQPAIIRNQHGLDAANQAIKDFNSSMADFAEAGAERDQRMYCRANPDAAECKKKDDDDDKKDDNKDDSQNQTGTNTNNTTNQSANTNTKIQTGPNASITTQISSQPTKITRGGAITTGTKQNYASDMEADMYDDYTKRKSWAYNKNVKNLWNDDTES